MHWGLLFLVANIVLVAARAIPAGKVRNLAYPTTQDHPGVDSTAGAIPSTLYQDLGVPPVGVTARPLSTVSNGDDSEELLKFAVNQEQRYIGSTPPDEPTQYASTGFHAESHEEKPTVEPHVAEAHSTTQDHLGVDYSTAGAIPSTLHQDLGVPPVGVTARPLSTVSNGDDSEEVLKFTVNQEQRYIGSIPPDEPTQYASTGFHAESHEEKPTVEPRVAEAHPTTQDHLGVDSSTAGAIPSTLHQDLGVPPVGGIARPLLTVSNGDDSEELLKFTVNQEPHYVSGTPPDKPTQYASAGFHAKLHEEKSTVENHSTAVIHEEKPGFKPHPVEDTPAIHEANVTPEEAKSSDHDEHHLADEPSDGFEDYDDSNGTSEDQHEIYHGLEKSDENDAYGFFHTHEPSVGNGPYDYGEKTWHHHGNNPPEDSDEYNYGNKQSDEKDGYGAIQADEASFASGPYEFRNRPLDDHEDHDEFHDEVYFSSDPSEIHHVSYHGKDGTQDRPSSLGNRQRTRESESDADEDYGHGQEPYIERDNDYHDNHLFKEGDGHVVGDHLYHHGNPSEDHDGFNDEVYFSSDPREIHHVSYHGKDDTQDRPSSLGDIQRTRESESDAEQKVGSRPERVKRYREEKNMYGNLDDEEEFFDDEDGFDHDGDENGDVISDYQGSSYEDDDQLINYLDDEEDDDSEDTDDYHGRDEDDDDGEDDYEDDEDGENDYGDDEDGEDDYEDDDENDDDGEDDYEAGDEDDDDLRDEEDYYNDGDAGYDDDSRGDDEDEDNYLDDDGDDYNEDNDDDDYYNREDSDEEDDYRDNNNKGNNHRDHAIDDDENDDNEDEDNYKGGDNEDDGLRDEEDDYNDRNTGDDDYRADDEDENTYLDDDDDDYNKDDGDDNDDDDDYRHDDLNSIDDDKDYVYRDDDETVGDVAEEDYPDSDVDQENGYHDDDDDGYDEDGYDEDDDDDADDDDDDDDEYDDDYDNENYRDNDVDHDHFWNWRDAADDDDYDDDDVDYGREDEEKDFLDAAGDYDDDKIEDDSRNYDNYNNDDNEDDYGDRRDDYRDDYLDEDADYDDVGNDDEDYDNFYEAAYSGDDYEDDDVGDYQRKRRMAKSSPEIEEHDEQYTGEDLEDYRDDMKKSQSISDNEVHDAEEEDDIKNPRYVSEQKKEDYDDIDMKNSQQTSEEEGEEHEDAVKNSRFVIEEHKENEDDGGDGVTNRQFTSEEVDEERKDKKNTKKRRYAGAKSRSKGNTKRKGYSSEDDDAEEGKLVGHEFTSEEIEDEDDDIKNSMYTSEEEKEEPDFVKKGTFLSKEDYLNEKIKNGMYTSEEEEEPVIIKKVTHSNKENYDHEDIEKLLHRSEKRKNEPDDEEIKNSMYTSEEKKNEPDDEEIKNSMYTSEEKKNEPDDEEIKNSMYTSEEKKNEPDDEEIKNSMYTSEEKKNEPDVVKNATLPSKEDFDDNVKKSLYSVDSGNKKDDKSAVASTSKPTVGSPTWSKSILKPTGTRFGVTLLDTKDSRDTAEAFDLMMPWIMPTEKEGEDNHGIHVRKAGDGEEDGGHDVNAGENINDHAGYSGNGGDYGDNAEDSEDQDSVIRDDDSTKERKKRAIDLDSVNEKKNSAIEKGTTTVKLFAKNRGSLFCIVLTFVAIIVVFMMYQKAYQYINPYNEKEGQLNEIVVPGSRKKKKTTKKDNMELPCHVETVDETTAAKM